MQAPGVSTRPDQVVISAQNRNFPGRSGPGQMYLASPLDRGSERGGGLHRRIRAEPAAGTHNRLSAAEARTRDAHPVPVQPRAAVAESQCPVSSPSQAMRVACRIPDVLPTTSTAICSRWIYFAATRATSSFVTFSISLWKVLQKIQRIAVKLVGHLLLQNLLRRIEAEDKRIQNRILGALDFLIVNGTLGRSAISSSSA